MELQNIEKIKEIIREAEMILIGVGEEMQPALPECLNEEMACIRPFAESRYYASLPEDAPIIASYKKLKKLIGVKPYFVVTLNTDDLVYRGGFWKDLVVAPCGSMSKMQCMEHIVETSPVCDRVLESVRRENVQGNMTSESADRIVSDIARCPECGQPLHFHIKSEEGYLEKGYLEQWKSYNNWLTCTLGHKLCILELGVGFQYPQVIRWPFEKMAYYNQKATLIRVHSRLPQTAAELGDRAVSVPCMPCDFINGICLGDTASLE